MTSCRAHKLFDPGIFSSLENSGRFWNAPSLLLNSYRDSVPGVKAPGRDVDHSHPSSAEIKNDRSYTSISTTCFCEVDLDSFTVYFLNVHVIMLC